MRDMVGAFNHLKTSEVWETSEVSNGFKETERSA